MRNAEDRRLGGASDAEERASKRGRTPHLLGVWDAEGHLGAQGAKQQPAEKRGSGEPRRRFIPAWNLEGHECVVTSGWVATARLAPPGHRLPNAER